jgi:hypothetical protein
MFAVDRTAAPWRWGQSRIGGDLATVIELPKQPLTCERVCELPADTLERAEHGARGRLAVLSKKGIAFRFDELDLLEQ